MVFKEHWRYGLKNTEGKRVVEFKVDVKKESECKKCIHLPMCQMDMTKFCENYQFGNSSLGKGCDSCTHRFTRFDETKIECFKCRYFKESGIVEKDMICQDNVCQTDVVCAFFMKSADKKKGLRIKCPKLQNVECRFRMNS